MSSKSPKNTAASVRQRLLDKARSDQRPFNELLQYYAMERFLYRLSLSPHSGRFILKGALMLRVWRSPQFRPTMDIDMLGRTDNDEAAILRQVREILGVQPTPPDGMAFDASSVTAERIAEAADYEGVRIRFAGALDRARINMRIDIGFGDIVFPGPEEADLPVILDFPAPRLFCYSRESAIAEKFEAMVKLGTLNSRMKDFYDIWLLARQFDFDGAKLTEAVRLTFERRGTVMPAAITAFSKDFVDAKKTQWAAFHNRLAQETLPADFDRVALLLEAFLSPVAAAIRSDSPAPNSWLAPGPWI